MDVSQTLEKPGYEFIKKKQIILVGWDYIVIVVIIPIIWLYMVINDGIYDHTGWCLSHSSKEYESGIPTPLKNDGVRQLGL